MVDFINEIGSVVGRHATHHAGRFGVGASLEELQLVLGVQLFENVGFEFAVMSHRFDDFDTLFMARALDKVGDLRGVES